MPNNEKLTVALKEWRTVCNRLVAGDDALILRKGGVHEDQGPGRFRLDHDRFALFPATEHERLDWLKPEHREGVEPVTEPPAAVTLTGFAEVARAWTVPSRAAFDQLDDLHPWAPEQIDMRFNYKPDRPLYLVALRAFRAAVPVTVPMTDAYWGCRSWVDLTDTDALPTADATPAMPPATLDALTRRVEVAFNTTKR